MSELESKLEDLKTVLNALVIPHPNGLTLRHLCNDYKENEGEMIPFKDFGFTSVTALLKSMPNMIRMSGDLQDINSVVLFPVKNENTKHIIDLVQKQSKNRKRSGRPIYTRSSFVNHYRNPNNFRSLSKSATNFRNESQSIHSIQYTNLVTNTLFNDLFMAYYKYFDALKPYNHNLNMKRSLQDPQITNTNFVTPNVSHFSRPLINNKVLTSRPLLQTPIQGSVPSANKVGYTPKTIVDYNNSQLMTHQSNQTLISQKFLDLRITKNLNKLNDQQSRVVETRHSDSNLKSYTINGQSKQSPTPSQTPLIEPIDTSKSHLIPNQLKENIRLMMSSSDIEDGFMIYNFEARYKHQFKQHFDYKSLGFQNLSDCLKTMPEVLEMIPTGTKTFKLVPLKNGIINNMVSTAHTVCYTTTTTVITNGNSMAIITSTATSTSLTFVTTHSTITTTTTISPSPKKGFTNVSPNPKPLTTVVSTTPQKTFTIAGKQNSTIESVFRPIECPKAADNDESFDNESVCSNSQLIPNGAKINFRRILCFHENGINAIDFGSEYEKAFKCPFDSRLWGFKSAIEMFHGLPHIFSIEVNENNEEILHDSRFKKFEKPKPSVKIDINIEYKLREIPDVLKARILRLIKMSLPLGLNINQFVDYYNVNYEPIEPTLRKLRISDSLELFEIVRHELPVKIMSIEGRKRAFINSNEELSKWIVRQSRALKYIIPITLVDIPANVVQPGEHYNPMVLPDKFKPGNYEYVAVYISSAVNPHEIFIQFKGADYHTALETLMFNLDFYETADGEQWSVPFEFLYVGYPVVCQYPGDKNWHRARISRVHANNKRVVTVSFVDYGGTTLIDYKDLRLMKKEFLSLPVQAFKVGLYGIRPVKGTKPIDWTASARDKVLKFSRPQYALACTLIEFRPDNHWVAICDTNSNEDVFLHVVLVNDKHAVMIEDSEQ